jgi:hypothetical protein
MLKTFKFLIFRGIAVISILGLLLWFFPPSAFSQEDEGGGLYPPYKEGGENALFSFPATFSVWVEKTGEWRAELWLRPWQEELELGLTLEWFINTLSILKRVEVTRAIVIEDEGIWIIQFRSPRITDFLGARVTENSDGSYTFDFKDFCEWSQINFHVEGEIIKTNGRKVEAGTVEFSNVKNATVTVALGGGAPPSPPPTTTPPTGTLPPTTQPPTTGITPPATQQPTPSPTGGPAPSGGGLSTTWIIIIAFAALFVLAIIVLIVSLSMRKRRPPQAGYPYAPPPPPPPQAGPAPGYMFCPNCGKQVPQGTRFCPYCGFQIGAPTPPQAPTPPNFPENPPPPPETPQS